MRQQFFFSAATLATTKKSACDAGLLSQDYAARNTYSMAAIFGAVEMDHAVDAGKRCAAAFVPMRIEFLLGEDIPAVL